MTGRFLVLDANIMIRYIFGRRVRKLFLLCDEAVVLCAAESCFDEVLNHLATIARYRGADADEAREQFGIVTEFVQMVGHHLYQGFRGAAVQRISSRDEDDWQTVAAAMAMDCPIWTEDQDFFGCGIATWTCRTVEIYLKRE